MTISFELSQIISLPDHQDETSVRMEAVRSFNQAVTRGRIAQLTAKLLHRDNHLKSLTTQPASSLHPTSQVVTVPIRQIKGSLGRCEDFDASFNPIQERSRSRWVSILTAIRSNIPLPPVELVRVGDAYYVQDGHHRISVAHALDQEAIEACIVN
jgi:hypothetical protein